MDTHFCGTVVKSGEWLASWRWVPHHRDGAESMLQTVDMALASKLFSIGNGLKWRTKGNTLLMQQASQVPMAAPE